MTGTTRSKEELRRCKLAFIEYLNEILAEPFR
jgi:hypothetical protein